MKGMVSKSKFSNIELILPSVDLQIRYSKIFEKAMSWVEDSKNGLREAERMFASLTQDVFKLEQKSKAAA